MSMKAWIKRPLVRHSSNSVQHYVPLMGISAAEVIQKQGSGEVSLKFTLPNSRVLETNAFALPAPPSIKSIRAVEKPGNQVTFEVELTDGRKIETNALRWTPPASSTILTVAGIRDTLFATSLGLDYGATERSELVLDWNKDYMPSLNNITRLGNDKASIFVNKQGKLTVQIALALKIKVKANVWMIRLWIMKKGRSWRVGEAKIRFPPGKPGREIVFEAGPYRFENLVFLEKESFEVVLQCYADEKIHIGVNAGRTTLEVMWFQL